MGVESRHGRRRTGGVEFANKQPDEAPNRRGFLGASAAATIGVAGMVAVVTKIRSGAPDWSSDYSQPLIVLGESAPCSDERMTECTTQEREFLEAVDLSQQAVYHQLMNKLDEVVIDQSVDRSKPYAVYRGFDCQSDAGQNAGYKQADPQGCKKIQGNTHPPKVAATHLSYNMESGQGSVEIELYYWLLPQSEASVNEQRETVHGIFDTQEIEVVVHTPEGVLTLRQLNWQVASNSEHNRLMQLSTAELLQEFSAYKTREVGYRPVDPQTGLLADETWYAYPVCCDHQVAPSAHCEDNQQASPTGRAASVGYHAVFDGLRSTISYVSEQ